MHAIATSEYQQQFPNQRTGNIFQRLQDSSSFSSTHIMIYLCSLRFKECIMYSPVKPTKLCLHIYVLRDCKMSYILGIIRETNYKQSCES
jgi:hypothetical protein